MPEHVTLTAKELATLATTIRISVVSMLTKAGSGHTASALGMADLFAALYFTILKNDPQKPDWDKRDYLLLSSGHTCPLLYATLAERGYFPKEELLTLRKLGSRLQGHPHLHSLPGIENTSGPLGQGLSQALGLALALKMDSKENHVFCVMSDAEQHEGQVWEAYLYAGAHAVGNLTVLLDRNHIQIGGETDEILPLGSLAKKIHPFGWNTIEIDGHSFSEIQTACLEAQKDQSKPTAIICNTTPGKGVDFIENDYHWHGEVPTEQEGAEALAQLKKQL